MVNGFWGGNNLPCCIINVYSSCVSSAKSELWDRLALVIDQLGDVSICILGDFNSIRTSNERVGRSDNWGRSHIRKFDDFITDSTLIDLPLHGRKFTWYKPDGSCKSRIDRILVK